MILYFIILFSTILYFIILFKEFWNCFA